MPSIRIDHADTKWCSAKSRMKNSRIHYRAKIFLRMKTLYDKGTFFCKVKYKKKTAFWTGSEPIGFRFPAKYSTNIQLPIFSYKGSQTIGNIFRLSRKDPNFQAVFSLFFSSTYRYLFWNNVANLPFCDSNFVRFSTNGKIIQIRITYSSCKDIAPDAFWEFLLPRTMSRQPITLKKISQEKDVHNCEPLFASDNFLSCVWIVSYFILRSKLKYSRGKLIRKRENRWIQVYQ
jgi:hypothetical protein